MSQLRSLGISSVRRTPAPQPDIPFVLTRQPLHRILSFTRRTIDDVINDPIARNEVLGYYKLHKFVQRRYEIVDLERQWNANKP